MTATERALLDVNVLVALAWPNHVHHGAAHSWFGQAVDRPFATCPLTEAGFVRLSTNAHVTGSSALLPDAVALLVQIRSLPGHVFIADDTSLASPIIDTSLATSSRHVTDLHLVNLAAAHGAVLSTFDRSITSLLSPGDRRHVKALPLSPDG